MTPQEAIRRAEALMANDYQIFSTKEAREIIAGLLEALNIRSGLVFEVVDTQMKKILEAK